jgi:hypothetical protein
MNIEKATTKIYKWRLHDFSRPEEFQMSTGVFLVTNHEAKLKNYAYQMNRTQKKLIKEK